MQFSFKSSEPYVTSVFPLQSIASNSIMLQEHEMLKFHIVLLLFIK